MEEEIKYLNYTIDKYDEVICDSSLKLKNLKELYKNNYDAMLEEKFKLAYNKILDNTKWINKYSQLN